MATELENIVKTKQGTQTLEIPNERARDYESQAYTSYSIQKVIQRKLNVDLNLRNIITLAWAGLITGGVAYKLYIKYFTN